MAKGKKTGGRNFKSGDKWTGNSSGRPKLPGDVKAIRNLAKEEYARILQDLMYLDAKDLEKFVKEKKGTAMQMAAANILQEAIKKGDQWRLESLLARLIGPVPKNLVSQDEDGNALPLIQICIPANGFESDGK